MHPIQAFERSSNKRCFPKQIETRGQAAAKDRIESHRLSKERFVEQQLIQVETLKVY